MMKELEEMKKVAGIVDRAIALCDKFVPIRAIPTDDDQAPQKPVRTVAVGLLVAVRSVLEAVIEEGDKRAKK